MTNNQNSAASSFKAAPLTPKDLMYYGFVEVPEEMILKLWMRGFGNEINEYDSVINRAKQFSEHGLTPCYFSNNEGTLLYVTSSEYIRGMLN